VAADQRRRDGPPLDGLDGALRAGGLELGDRDPADGRSYEGRGADEGRL
jgi:hypothetical protein